MSIFKYLKGIAEIAGKLDVLETDRLVKNLMYLRTMKGRLFLLGVGGSAATCSHAAADFRNLCGIDAYALDNMTYLTAITNDHGWDWVFREWLLTFDLTSEDLVLIISVGGGDVLNGISANLIKAMDEAKAKGAKIAGIVGRDGGYTKQAADVCLIIPPIDPSLITCYTESFHSVILHLLVSQLQLTKPKWEAIT